MPELAKIYHMMNKVLYKVIDVEADVKKLPRTYLLPNRESGEDCPRCRGKSERKLLAADQHISVINTRKKSADSFQSH